MSRQPPWRGPAGQTGTAGVDGGRASASEPTAGGSSRAGWDTVVPARPFQTLWVALAVLAAGPGLVATALRLTAPTDDIPALFASFVSYGVLAYLLSSVFFAVALLRGKRRGVLAILTGVSVLLLGCHLAWLAPFFVSDHREAGTPSFTLMSLNTLFGSADPEQVARQAQQADVVVLLEATTPGLQGLQPYGWGKRFPYSVGTMEGQIGDTVVYSRFPLTQPTALSGGKFQQWVVTADVPGVGPVRIIAAHPCNPFCGGNAFEREHQQIRSAAGADLGRPLVVAGDLNAVDDHGPLRDLRHDGLESVTDIAGAGWLPTYPANRAIPPLLPIDHILVNHFLTATSVETFHVDDTDHLGLVARIAGAR